MFPNFGRVCVARRSICNSNSLRSVHKRLLHVKFNTLSSPWITPARYESFIPPPLSNDEDQILKNKLTLMKRLNYERESSDEFETEAIYLLKNYKLNSWELRSLLFKLHKFDKVPEPLTLELIFRQCHMQNDLPLAIRYVETIFVQCKTKYNHLYQYLMEQTTDVRRELGIPTLEELGYNKPELYVNDQRSFNEQLKSGKDYEQY